VRGSLHAAALVLFRSLPQKLYHGLFAALTLFVRRI